MKKVILGITAAALLAVPATASAGNAYGKEIQTCLEATYGQAKNAAWSVTRSSLPPATPPVPLSCWRAQSP